MNTLRYKRYTARIDFDDRDEVFVGRVMGIRDIISFHSDTVAGLRQEFAGAIDDYLADCNKRGEPPEQPASGKILLRLSAELHGSALAKAKAAGMSLNQWATDVLARAVG